MPYVMPYVEGLSKVGSGGYAGEHRGVREVLLKEPGKKNKYFNNVENLLTLIFAVVSIGIFYSHF